MSSADGDFVCSAVAQAQAPPADDEPGQSGRTNGGRVGPQT
jgi:hypothetical protein